MNVDRIDKLVRQFGASRAGELVVEGVGWRVALRRGGPSLPPAASRVVLSQNPEETTPGETEQPGVAIPAPLVGIFRQGDRAIHPGDSIAPGETVGSIESMKILNPVVSELGGDVLEVLIEDGVPVEYGQHLYRLLPVADASGLEGAVWADEEESEAGR